MSNITLRTKVTSVEVTGGGYNSVDIEIDGLDTDDVFSMVDVSEAISAYGQDSILDQIGRDEIIAYFGIEEAEE